MLCTLLERVSAQFRCIKICAELVVKSQAKIKVFIFTGAYNYRYVPQLFYSANVDLFYLLLKQPLCTCNLGKFSFLNSELFLIL